MESRKQKYSGQKKAESLKMQDLKAEIPANNEKENQTVAETVSETMVQFVASDNAVQELSAVVLEKTFEYQANSMTEQKNMKEEQTVMNDNNIQHDSIELNEHSEEVRSMFKAITSRYDLLNHICSLGIDFWWRKVLVSGFVFGKNKKFLDMAAGTLDVSVAALKKYDDIQVVAGDICPEMLEYGKKKIRTKDADRIWIKTINALSIPYDEKSFDIVSIAFGIRNVDDRIKALSEMHRVLTVGGQLHVLEFSPVKNLFLKKCYYFYLEKIMPALAKLLGENVEAYKYLGRTIKNFPNQKDFCAEIKQAGFDFIGYKKLTFGIVTIYTAIKSK